MSTKHKFDDNLDWCFEILEDVSRTFSIPINMIESDRSKEVCIGYLICRISDTIEDDPSLKIEDKNELFELYRKVIKSKEPKHIQNFVEKAREFKPKDPEEPKHWELLLNTDRLFSVYREFDDEVHACVDKPAIEMLDGMKEYCNNYPDGMRFQTIKELDNYCYYVAGTVGNMLTNLASIHNNLENIDDLREHAQKYGLLLQLVNIIKDINEDYESENNIYIPRDLTNKFNIEQENIVHNSNKSKSKQIIEQLIDHAEENIHHARSYLKELSKLENANVRSWSIPYLLAIATLRELNNKKSKVLTQNIKITRDEVYCVIDSVQDSSYEQIRSLEKKIIDKPLNKY